MPERLALMGDVHANLPALRAVLGAIAEAGLTRGACTGDLVMRGPEPEACVAEVRRLGWPCVVGNTDRKVAHRPPRPKDHEKAQRVGSRAWSTNQLSAASLAYLAGLPMVWRLTVKDWSVAIVHGSPDDPRQAVEDGTPKADVRRLIRSLGDPDCIVSGHTHRPSVRRVDGCLLVNPGSVGEALDGDLRPRWAWLEAGRSGLRAHLETVDMRLATVRSP
ncbi:MAG TPA: metallophosphoesterase family protein [Miltoncostaeaceae bacterium]|jgi:putative phosphoesterase|nr:metallophosphoesterase family protein [Miltoncostaeaceae bacterium]